MRSSESVGVVVLLVAQQAGILMLHTAHAKVAGESDPGSGLVAQPVSEGCHHQPNTICRAVPGSLQLLAQRDYPTSAFSRWKRDAQRIPRLTSLASRKEQEGARGRDPVHRRQNDRKAIYIQKCAQLIVF